VDSHLGNYTDPLPQALVLTAIVIAFAMTAVSIVLASGRSDNHSDHVDAHEPDDDLQDESASPRQGEDRA
jgi:multicomponent K+:H+ antiporter subunit C